MLRNLGALLVSIAAVAAVMHAQFEGDPPSGTTSFWAGRGTCIACLVCAFITIAARPKALPWVLEAIKAFILFVVIGGAAVAVAATGEQLSSLDEVHPATVPPARFVVLVGLLCCLPPLLMSSPGATVRAVPLVVRPTTCAGCGCPCPPRHPRACSTLVS